MKKGHRVGNKSYKVHLDGYDMTDYLTGKTDQSPRTTFHYFTDDGDYSAIRWGDWKVMYSVQDAHGLAVWQRPFVPLRTPYIFNLRQDPFERAHYEAGAYDTWFFEHLFILYGALSQSQQFLLTFKEFPPRQKPASFSIDQIVERLMNYQSAQYK